MTVNLGLSQVAGNQNNKFITINDATGGIDAAMTASFAAEVTSSNALTMTAAQLREAFFIVVDEDGGDPAAAAIILTIPAIARGSFEVINNTAFDVTVTIASQLITAPVVATGSTILMTSDGVNVKQAGGGGGSSAGTIEVGAFVGGVPSTSVILLRYLAPTVSDFPVNLANSVGHATTAPNAQTDFDIQVNGVSQGTMRFEALSNVATFIAGGSFSILAGERFDVVSPANLNLLADLSFTLLGSKG